MMQVFDPHPYQQRGIDLLTSGVGGAGLLLDPGMGKTAIALYAFTKLKEQYPGLQMLVILPINPMYGTWPDECKKWFQFRDLRLSIIHGTPKQRENALSEDADIYLVNPEGVRWLFDPKREASHPDWKVLCVDESTKFKNSGSKRFRVLRTRLERFYWRWIMTGTIAPNGLEDLFGQIYLMDGGKALGQYITHFRQKYFMQVGYGGYTWEARQGAVEMVTSQIDSKTLQLKAEDYLNMPAFMVVKRKVALPIDAMQTYDEMEAEFVLELGTATVVANSAAAVGIKCRQIANGAVYDEDGDVVEVHDAKLEALQDIVEETNGHNLLIMYEFKHDKERILKHLGKDAVCLTGMKGSELKRAVDDFNSGKIRYLVMHPGSTHGMNIQKSCHHIVWFSIIWNLEHYIQANTRLYRQGQSAKQVLCYHLEATSTLDVVVSRALRTKDATQKDIESNLRRYCGVPAKTA